MRRALSRAQSLAATAAATRRAAFSLRPSHALAFGVRRAIHSARVTRSDKSDKQAQRASSALAIAPSSTSSADSPAGSIQEEAETSGAHFAESAPAPPKAPVSYVLFQASYEWQLVQENHILPPGLQIQMDFDSDTKHARLPPPPAAAAPARQQTQQEQPQQEAQQEAQVQEEKQEPQEQESAPADAAATEPPSEPGATQVPSSVSNRTAASGSKTSLVSPGAAAAASTLGQQKRGVHSGKAVFSSRTRPVYYPSFPPPTAAFLASRAPMPRPPEPVISVAPMVDVTDRHFRYMLRLLSKRVVLYTAMIVDNALLRAPYAHQLYTQHSSEEYPLVAQLGGSHKDTMVKAGLICQAQGFQEVNVNVGCPAPSASAHHHGCILMGNLDFPHTLRALVDALDIPVTVKCRIGVNKDESFEYFCGFIERCWKIGGVTRFIVHARKAVLSFKTSKNLTVPPLKYDYAHRLKQLYPELHIEINGGFDRWDKAEEQISQHGMQGVMVGRLAWKNPYALAEVDRKFYGCTKTPPSRLEVMNKYMAYAEEQWERYLQALREFEENNSKTEAAEGEQSEDASSASTSSSSPPSETLPPLPPHALDMRLLLKPASYLYAGEPGFKRFRQLYEECMQQHLLQLQSGVAPAQALGPREILERCMTSVEPPPLREWGAKDPGFEYCEQAKEDLRRAEERKKQAEGVEDGSSSSGQVAPLPSVDPLLAAVSSLSLEEPKLQASTV